MPTIWLFRHRRPDLARFYGEFGAKNRAEGWNLWLTFAISPSAEAHMAAKPVIRK
jgi:hypothetical protein